MGHGEKSRLSTMLRVRVPKARPREVIADGTAQFQRPQHFRDASTMALPSMIAVAVE